MNIHEYQAKMLLREHHVAIPVGEMVSNVEQAEAVAAELGGPVWVVKAQVHAGGRGKGGGVKVCQSVSEVVEATRNMIGTNLVTHQTGPSGKQIRKVYIEDGCQIQSELYIAILLDRKTSRLSLIGSSEGGTEIEEVAARDPDKIKQISIDPITGLRPFHASNLGKALGLKGKALDSIVPFIAGLYDVYMLYDANVVEINPAVITSDEDVLALDAKIDFDDNALYKHPDIASLKDLNEEDPIETEASKYGLAYIKLDGKIGCMVNGAGLAMATMDIIKLYGAEPANFLDVGGGASKEKVSAAFKIILSDKNVRGILINIFGGIMRCDVLAQGVVDAAKEIKLAVPLVVRLAGTNVKLGKEILKKSNLKIISADNLSDAAEKIVEVTK